MGITSSSSSRGMNIYNHVFFAVRSHLIQTIEMRLIAYKSRKVENLAEREEYKETKAKKEK